MYVCTQCIIVIYIQTTSTCYTHTHRLTVSLRFFNPDEQATEGLAEGINVFATEDGAKQAKQQSICKGNAYLDHALKTSVKKLYNE